MTKKKTVTPSSRNDAACRRDAKTLCHTKMSRQIGSLWCCFVILFWIGDSVNSQDLMCCSHTTGSCRSVCEKISLVQLAANIEMRKQTAIEVQNYCSNQLVAFWDCLNATFRDMSRGDSWPGRMCCSIPHSETCRRACVTASSVDDLDRSCRKSDEIPFFSCLNRQQKGRDCCNGATEEGCRLACRDIFSSQLTPNKFKRQRLKEECELSDSNVLECVKDIVKVTPVTNTHEHIHCCDKSNIIKCRDTCKELLSTKNLLQEEIFDGLTLGGCGLPLPQEFFWQCFLKSSATRTISTSADSSRIERVGMDSAKWHCCSHANSTECSRLCSKTFTKSWASSWSNFLSKCLSSPREEALRNCIDEVDEPCELGCEGLSFCTNFNNRPTELFKSCTAQADEAARSEFRLTPRDLTDEFLAIRNLSLPMKNGEKCANFRKTMACILQIKPCSRYSHANQICPNTCISMLSECLDWTRLSPVYSAEYICQTFLPDISSSASCIDVNDYLTPSTSIIDPRMQVQVSSPCRGNPCEPNEICLINQSCSPDVNCQPYVCEPGCRLGEVSLFMVPHGTYVRIPIPNNQKGSMQICKCNKHKIDDCQPLLDVSLTSCLLGSTQQRHGSSFSIDCNSCSCYAGEVICTKTQCENNALSGRNTAYTTLPCNCPPHFVPVCGRNGVTYASACLAKCSGLNDADIEQGPCQNPCKPNSCAIGQKCVAKPQTCLSLMHKPCRQYVCVNGTTNCWSQPKNPVCDVEYRQFENACNLAHNSAKLAYWGPCLLNCRHKGQVCGINGRTYSSECAAHADMISVDYEGPCRAIGLISNAKSRSCAYVKCPKLSNPECLGITPPGACCPLCGGSIRLLYSRRQIDRALYALQNNTDSVNLKSLLQALQRQIQVAQCTVRGYLTVETDIFVVVQSTRRNSSELQLEACIREAEKIANLVNMHSPRIASELSLSSLTFASVVHTRYTINGGTKNTSWLILVVLVMPLLSIIV